MYRAIVTDETGKFVEANKVVNIDIDVLWPMLDWHVGNK